MIRNTTMPATSGEPIGCTPAAIIDAPLVTSRDVHALTSGQRWQPAVVPRGCIAQALGVPATLRVWHILTQESANA